MRRHLFLLPLLLILPSLSRAQTPAAPQASADVALLLERSGRHYSKVGERVWEVRFEGKSLKDISVRVTLEKDVVVAVAKVSDRKELKLDLGLLLKLLQANDDYDYVKFALTESMLYTRMDTPLRLLDVEELNHVLDQVSASADEIHAEVQPFLEDAK